MSKDIINQTIGKNIRYFRKLKGLTLLELANQLGLSEGTVQRYESRNITNVSISIAVEFAKVLNTTPQVLMGWEPITYTAKQQTLLAETASFSDEQYDKLFDYINFLKLSKSS